MAHLKQNILDVETSRTDGARAFSCCDKHHNVLNRLWKDGLSCVCLYM
jgi:hypothetical protein